MKQDIPAFFRFALVGSVGFVVDAAVLYLAIAWLATGLFASRLLSYFVAATVTWLLNRRFTFAPSDDSSRYAAANQWSRYVAVNGVGALVNLGVYSLAIILSDICRQHPILPLALGSGVAMIVNYLFSKHLVFSPSKTS